MQQQQIAAQQQIEATKAQDEVRLKELELKLTERIAIMESNVKMAIAEMAKNNKKERE
jgi:hypothetical protein